MIGLNRLGLPARPVLSARIRSEPFLYATTATPGETVTIHRITPTGGSITISWGDGEATTVAAGVTTAQAHVYAAAGTFEIRVTPLILVTQLDIHDAKLSGFRSAQLAGNAITYFFCYSIGNVMPGRFDSADAIAWNPTDFRLYLMPAGYSGKFDSADVIAWNPTTFYLVSMPAGYTIVSGGGFASFRRATVFRMESSALPQLTVNAILWELYQASATPRTGVGGTINVGGTNAAPSGTHQAAAACPVSVATPGKEVAHELLNDTCAAGFNRWTTCTFTA